MPRAPVTHSVQQSRLVSKPASKREAASIANAIGLFRRQSRVVLRCALLGLALGVAFLFVFKPGFLATATLMIDTRKLPDSAQSSVVARQTYDSSAAIDSQVEVLKSETIAHAVVTKLALFDDPEFTQPPLTLHALISSFFTLPPDTLTASRAEREGRATAYFIKHFTAKRVSDTFSIDASFESKYADRSAEVANQAAQAYIDWERDRQRESLNEASAWLEERIKDLSERSTSDQKSIAAYQASNNIVELGDGRSADDKHLTALTTELETARTQEANARVALDTANKMTVGPASTEADLAKIAEIANLLNNDNEIKTLQAQAQDLSSRYATLSGMLPANHQVLMQLRSALNQLHSRVGSELVRARMVLKTQDDVAQAKVKSLESDLSSSVTGSRSGSTAQIDLKQREITARTYQDLYDTFSHKYAEAIEAQKAPTIEASIISRAEAPTIRNFKKALIFAGLFPLLGLACGAGIAFVRESVNRKFWTGRDIESELRLPCIAIVQDLRAEDREAAAPGPRPKTVATGDAKARTFLRDPRQVAWSAIEAPWSKFAEEIRSVRVHFAMGPTHGARGGVVGITSALPNEGKTTISLATALSLAAGGAKVILVDCDLRNPLLTRSLVGENAGARLGLNDLLMGKATLSEVIAFDADTNLAFIPAAVSAEEQYGSLDLLRSGGLVALFAQLKNEYDLVIADLSPMSPIIDVAVTNRFVDSYVVVVEWGASKIETVRHCLENMPQIYHATSGVVLNKVDLKLISKYDYHISDYYSSKYENRYGIKTS